MEEKIKTVVDEAIENENINPDDENQEEENIELEIAFDGDTPTPNEDEEFEYDESQTEVFRNLRSKYKDTSKELKALRKELESLKTNQVQEIKQEEVLTLPAKPKLENFDYDEVAFDEAIEKWYEQKNIIESKKKEQDRVKQEEEQQWQQKVANYVEETKKLKVSDYSESEDAVKEKLTQVQQGIILDAVKNPAQFVYALGKSSKLNEISKINNPILFAAEIARLETQIKVNSKTQKAPPPPEKAVRGSTGGNIDTKLEQLRKDAEKTGDFSKLFAYKKQIKR